MNEKKSRKVFKTPFSAEYWQLALREMTSLRIIILAALVTAMRIAVKSISIPVGPNLNITAGFIFNAVGSMIYGPVVAILASAVSDTLGAVLFPHGAYFFPFIFEEIAGGLIFALFYYRAKLSAARVILGRFAVTVIVNLMISPCIMYYYYKLVLGKSYTFLSLPRMIKNVTLFPLQSLLLIVLFNLLTPVTNAMELTFTGKEKLELSRNNVVLIASLTAVSAAAIAIYYFVF